jgi:hypothetical protein
MHKGVYYVDIFRLNGLLITTYTHTLISSFWSRMNFEPKYLETLSEPWITLISLGLKTLEGRKNKGRFK